MKKHYYCSKFNIFNQFFFLYFCQGAKGVEWALRCELSDDHHHIAKVLPLAGNRGDIIDIGANVGLYSIFLAKYFPEKRIFSFEPNLTSRQCFQKGVIRNNIKNITISPKALGRKDGVGFLQMQGDNDLSCSLLDQPQDQERYKYSKVKSKAVNGILESYKNK